MAESLTLTAIFTPDENGWTMAQLAEWPAVVTCAPTLDEAREMLVDAAREMVASYREEGREPQFLDAAQYSAPGVRPLRKASA